jgi:hypothetical protein
MSAAADNVNHSNAKIAGMEEDLGLSGKSYAWLLTIFYILCYFTCRSKDGIADEPDVTSIEESEEIWIPQTHTSGSSAIPSLDLQVK